MTQAELDERNKARFAVRYIAETKYVRAGWALIDTTTGAEMGRDGGESEDQLLVRDWLWVQDLANALDAERINALAGVPDPAALMVSYRKMLAWILKEADFADVEAQGIVIRARAALGEK